MPLDLNFLASGKGPPLVILHGVFGSANNWKRIAADLAGNHRVLVVDLRNHGDSPWAESMSYPEMADDVAAVIGREAGGRATVIGHSMGGKAAMWLALSAPERVERLVVVDIAPVAYSERLSAYVAAMQAVDLAAVTRRADADAQLREAVPDAGIRAFLLQNLRLDADGARWRLNLDVLAAEMGTISDFPDPGERTYDGPTLFVKGAKSDYIRDAHRAAIARHFPNARARVVPGAGHWVHVEALEAFLRALRSFLGTSDAPE